MFLVGRNGLINELANFTNLIYCYRLKKRLKKFACIEVFEVLLSVYDRQRWWPGDTPFEIMVGAVLTQNTAWTNVERAIANLKSNQALSPKKILAAHHRSLAAWLRPSGYFNVKAKRLKSFCQWLIEQGGERKLSKWDTHALRHALLAVHGIGPETADDILLYAFQRPVFVIDAYTRRIFKRLGLIAGDESYEVLRQWFEKELNQEPDKVELFNEYHALIVKHGKDICKTRPQCGACCLRKVCKSKI